MSDSPLIAPDSCVFIEAARVPKGLCNLLFRLAGDGAFRICQLPGVRVEVERNLKRLGREAELTGLLSRCEVLKCVVDQSRIDDGDASRLLAAMGDPEDVPIALDLKAVQPRPKAFVTSNRKHWKDDRLRPLVGVEVPYPDQLLKRLGVQPPPKPKQKPRT